MGGVVDAARLAADSERVWSPVASRRGVTLSHPSHDGHPQL